jgi:predicted RNase H-like nuclease (RuvC/YqgF family)
MVSPEEQPAELNPPAPTRSPGGGRRRGRRGGRGRGRRRGHSSPAAQTEQPAEVSGEETIVEGTTTPAPQTAAVAHGRRDASTISQAVDEVREIVESLEQALEQMEEVRELVELAERQRFADEREIESLRRALRRIQQPRGHQEAQHKAELDG